jgi:beta-mannosidase
MPVKPEVSVEASEGGCLITLKADKFVRALALSIDGTEDYWLSNNYFDLLPGVPVKCFVRTTKSPSEVKQRLTYRSL